MSSAPSSNAAFLDSEQVVLKPEISALVFPALEALGCVEHFFTLRATALGEDPKSDESLRAIREQHERALQTIGYSRRKLAVAEQVHGNRIAVLNERPELPVAKTDGLLTKRRGLPLGIYVADCNAVFIVDRKTPVIALLHSGKLGTQLNIVGEAIETMRVSFGTNPADCLAVMSPSIGPCHYEMDIWTEIESQLAAAGVKDIVNPRICTACHVDKFYSYRAEKGRTGRLLAVLALK